MADKTPPPGSIYDADAWAKWAENEHHILDEVAYQNAISVFLAAVKIWRDNKIQGEGKTGWVNPPFPTPPPGYTPPAELPPPPPPKLTSHVGPSMGRGWYVQLEPATDPAVDGDTVQGPDGKDYVFVKGMIGGWYKLAK